MNVTDKIQTGYRSPGKGGLLIPIAFLWGTGLLIGVGFLFFASDIDLLKGDMFIIPWAIAAGIVLIIPSAVLFAKGKFDVFHPLTFAVWSYLFPAFVVGGFFIAFGWTDFFYLSFVQDPRTAYPLSLAYVSIGYLGVVAGFYLPIGKYFERALNKASKGSEWNLSDVWFAGSLLVLAGFALNIIGLLQGLLGFQQVTEASVFDGVIVYMSISFTIGSVLLWSALFKKKNWQLIHFLVFSALLLLVPIKMALHGSRSSLIVSLMTVVFAYWYSGRKIKPGQAAILGVVAALAVFIGIIYGTAFRSIKGSEARISAGDYFGQVYETVDYLSVKDPSLVFWDGMKALAERIENLSSLAVVVSNYEEMEPYEESYGLKNNIYNDLVTAFVPRILWPDKPSTSDARKYSTLYFNYGENSFAITPFADLLRNFGPFGVPLGMMIIGIYFRIIYGFLILTDRPRFWKWAAYFPLLTVVSYESFYAIIFPTLLRVLIVLAICLVFASVFVRSEDSPRAPATT